MPILFLSAGRRVGLVGCFRQASHALGVSLRVLACDLDPELSAACHIADAAFSAPPCDDPGYAESVLEIVRREGVRLVVPTIDPELLPLVEAAPRFAALKARLHLSERPVIVAARNKATMMDLLGEAGVPVPWTAPLDAIRESRDLVWPLFLKPSGGSSSRGIRIGYGPADLSAAEEPMIAQELLRGPEYTVNLFVDAAGTFKAAIPHRRLRVRAGEVEKGRTEWRPDLAAIAGQVARALPGARGALCFQLIDDERRGPRVFEVNARFGGGYPLADQAGGHFARWLLEETLGLPSTAGDTWRSGVTMLRYDAAVFCGE